MELAGKGRRNSQKNVYWVNSIGPISHVHSKSISGIISSCLSCSYSFLLSYLFSSLRSSQFSIEPICPAIIFLTNPLQALHIFLFFHPILVSIFSGIIKTQLLPYITEDLFISKLVIHYVQQFL